MSIEVHARLGPRSRPTRVLDFSCPEAFFGGGDGIEVLGTVPSRSQPRATRDSRSAPETSLLQDCERDVSTWSSAMMHLQGADQAQAGTQTQWNSHMWPSDSAILKVTSFLFAKLPAPYLACVTRSASACAGRNTGSQQFAERWLRYMRECNYLPEAALRELFLSCWLIGIRDEYLRYRQSPPLLPYRPKVAEYATARTVSASTESPEGTSPRRAPRSARR